MLKNKLISAVASALLITTSSMAFDVDSTGKLVMLDQTGEVTATSDYKDGKESNSSISISNNNHGDALIYPAFTMEDNSTTNISVRNTSDDGIVAKVVVYAASDSRELIDFNIYLSKKDVFQFKLENGNVLTNDASYSIEAVDAYDVTDATLNLGDIKPGNESPKFVGDTKHDGTTGLDSNGYYQINKVALGEESGYVIIYAMAQSDSTKSITGFDGYHKDHASLFNDYRLLLDYYRTTWRDVYNGGITNGIVTASSTQAPNVAINDNFFKNKVKVDTNTEAFSDADFKDPEAVLTGLVSIDQSSGTNSRAMTLQATAIENFTDGNMMLWTEGEYASIQDRRIGINGKYDAHGVLEDSKAFNTSSAEYVYEPNTANKLLLTQPYKRILVQLAISSNGNVKSDTDITSADIPWTNYNLSNNNYGYFSYTKSIFDKDENMFTCVEEGEEVGYDSLISPHTSIEGATVTLENPNHSKELAVFENIENDSCDTSKFEDKNTTSLTVNGGYVDVKPTKVIPAIVTQMVGKFVDGDAQTNWIYAPSKSE